MSNYTKTTDFEAKDSLPTGDSGKIIRGAEFETEFDAISTAIATKADTAGPTFTGTATFATISDGTIAVTAFVDEDDMSSNSATLVPTQQSVKAYVDSVTTELQAQDLDFQADSGGALNIDLDTETMTFTGGTGIDTTGSGNDVSFAIDSTVATLIGTQTLTNKTLTSADIDTPDIDGGTIDGTVIGGTTAAAVSATTVSATGNITVDGTVDGRDVATDGTKLDTVETNADVTDTTNVTAAGALMDSEVTNLAQVKAFDSADYATAAQGTTADNALPKTGGAMTGAITTNSTFDGRDVATDGTKLDGIEASADVTDTANVTAAGALMDSELTDLTAVKSLDQGVATTDSPTFAGLTTTANVSFGDNDKAIFGAGSDLQIYHDGSDSRIADAGTGYLAIDTNGSDIRLTSNSFAEYMAKFEQDGAATLYHNGSAKIATTSTGIDVTGAVSADGLTVDNGGSGLNYLQITNSEGSSRFGTDGGFARILDGSNNVSYASNGVDQYFYTDANTLRMKLATGGDISFYEDTGTTAKFFWDAADESLGIGTSSPSVPLDIKSANSASIKWQRTGVSAKEWGFVSDNDQTYLYNFTDGITSTSFNNNGNVGINTSSPDQSLVVNGQIGLSYDGTNSYQGLKRSGVGTVYYTGTTSTTTDAIHTFTGSSDAVKMTILEGGNVGIGTDSPDTMLHLSDTLGGAVLRLERNDTAIVATDQYGAIEFEGQDANAGANGVRASIRAIAEASVGQTSLTFSTAGSGASEAERMRIDSSGNLLVGTTSSSSNTAGIKLSSAGTASFVRSGVQPVYVNRLTNDGDLAVFAKDGTTVGSIGTVDGELTIGNGDTGLYFWGDSDKILPFNTTTNAIRDAAIDLGRTTTRFKDLYLSGSVIANGSILSTTGTAAAAAIRPNNDINCGIFFPAANTFAVTTNGSEAYRVDPFGNLLVGTTAAVITNGINLNAGGDVQIAVDSGEALYLNRMGTDGRVVNFRKAGSFVAGIDVTSTTVTYNTSSDQRLKANIVDAPSASDDIDAIQVRSFDWKADGSHQKYGMIAQELNTVAPEAVSEGETEEDMLGVDYSKLVPMLVKEIQSLRARVAQLETN